MAIIPTALNRGIKLELPYQNFNLTSTKEGSDGIVQKAYVKKKKNNMRITFEKANTKHIDTIFNWLQEPHIIEYWDNSQEHREDILNFIHGRSQYYFYGTTKYFVASIDNQPFAFLLADILKPDQELSELHRQHLSDKGHTISLDFGIGNTEYLGKGLAASTLKEFIEHYHNFIDPLAVTFFIEPDEGNPRAKHVYGKAGFEEIGKFEMKDGFFEGNQTYLMVKRI